VHKIHVYTNTHQRTATAHTSNASKQQLCRFFGNSVERIFSARCNIGYTSRAYAMSVSVCLSVCPSVCDGSASWSRCMPERGEGSSRAMLATARPSCPPFKNVQLACCCDAYVAGWAGHIPGTCTCR